MDSEAVSSFRAPATVLLDSLPRLLLFFGILLVFLTPPIQSADENSHFTRAVMVSEGNFGTRFDGTTRGQDVPASLVAYVEAHMSLLPVSAPAYTYSRWYEDSHAVTNAEDTILHSYSGQSLSPLYYIPQTIGIWVGKALYSLTPNQFNWPAALYFARLGNLVFYILVFTWAMRVAPQFASTLGFLSATPMGVGLAASCSYDVLVILSAVGFFAAVVAAANRQGAISKFHYALIVLLAFAVGHCKAVYAPVLLSLFMLWKPMGFRSFAILAVVSGVAAIAGVIFSSVVFGLPSDPSLQKAIDAQTDFVSDNLLAMPELVLRSFREFQDFYFVSGLGNLGWLNATFPLPFLVVWWGVGLIAVAADAISGSLPQRFVSAFVFLGGAVIALFALFVAMYISWTSLTTGIGAPRIDSVQGRYLLPLVPFVLAALALVAGSVLQQRPTLALSLARLQVTLSAATLSLVAFMIVLRYWIPD